MVKIIVLVLVLVAVCLLTGCSLIRTRCVIGTVEVPLMVVNCPKCDCCFAFTEQLYERMMRDSSKSVYCPNGHTCHFRAKKKR